VCTWRWVYRESWKKKKKKKKKSLALIARVFFFFFFFTLSFFTFPTAPPTFSPTRHPPELPRQLLDRRFIMPRVRVVVEHKAEVEEERVAVVLVARHRDRVPDDGADRGGDDDEPLQELRLGDDVLAVKSIKKIK
jgi:hypothetical protein